MQALLRYVNCNGIFVIIDIAHSNGSSTIAGGLHDCSKLNKLK